jgi:phospholipid/cholesterol/gamma-HCH transport system substrate-binding protein
VPGTDIGPEPRPNNHFELAQPVLVEDIWGRQIGENTINP